MCLFASHTSPLSAETPHQITPQVAGSCLRDSHPLFCLNARILLTTHQADAETLAVAKCRPGSVFGTVVTLSSVPGDLCKHTRHTVLEGNGDCGGRLEAG
jgi:hypothetical protein